MGIGSNEQNKPLSLLNHQIHPIFVLDQPEQSVQPQQSNQSLFFGKRSSQPMLLRAHPRRALFVYHHASSPLISGSGPRTSLARSKGVKRPRFHCRSGQVSD